ncbi:MAG: D-alanyl-D-alanine carboxypeptidase [Candidatus Delongbacteria bacterium]
MRRWSAAVLLLALLARGVNPAGSPQAPRGPAAGAPATGPASGLALPDSLAAWLDGLGGDSLLVQLAVSELTAGGARRLYGRLDELRQTPASLIKLCTASAALELWGPDHRIATRVAYDPGELRFQKKSGLLQVEHVWVEAGGDPSLGAEDLRQLFLQIWQAGVDQVSGPVCVLPNRFAAERQGPGWMWDDAGAPFAARPSDLTVQGNCLVARSGPGGWELPGSALLRVEHEAAARGAEARLTRRWEEARDEIFFIAPLAPPPSGPAPRWRVRPPDPACSVEHPDSLFRSVCFEAAQEVFGEARPPVLNGALALPVAPVWKQHLSPPLAQLLDSVLTESWNLGAECLFQGLALDRPGLTGTNWERAATLVERVLSDSLGVRGWRRQVDGSGISRYNSIAPRQFVELLAAMERRHPGLLRGLLPGTGEGTLRLDGPKLPAGVRLAAKTGTLRGVVGLAGYLERERGPRLAFCLLISGQQAGRDAVRLRNRVLTRLAAWLESVPEELK